MKSNVADNFRNSLTCVANRNPFVVKPKALAIADNTNWSEEDWADHFSAFTLNQMITNGSTLAKNATNLGCALVNSDGSNYTDNAMEPTSGDVHSGGLYRLLMTSFDRGQLTPACKPLLNYAATAHRVLTCQ